MKRYQRIAAKLLLPVSALCLLGPGLGRAQDNTPDPAAARSDARTTVTIEADGGSHPVSVPGGDVAAALAAAGITLGKSDQCSPAPDQPVQPGMVVTVQRIVVKNVVERQTIKAGTRVAPGRSLRPGITVIEQHPRDGVKELTYRVTTCDGVEISRELVGTRVARQPKEKVIRVGRGMRSLPSRGGYFTGRRTLRMVATGYPAMVCGTGRTYLGLKAERGIVAVDPRVIPLGARVYVEGYGEALAADIGSAIKGSRIDLCFPTHREADRYGKREVTVRILTP